MDLIDRSVGPMVRVELDAEGAVPTVDVDPNQLEMALLNLAVNARDAMVSGGVLTIGLIRRLSTTIISSASSRAATSCFRCETPEKAWTRKRWPRPWSHSSQRKKWARERVWACRWCSAWRSNWAVPCGSKALPQWERLRDCGCRSPRKRL